jgi:GAF domain-containing protein
VVGLPGVTETERESSFCAWTLLPPVPECLVVCDARSDARFANNLLVLGGPMIQFYAGCPTVSSDGSRLGSFCIIDSHRRHFSREDCQLLVNFADIAVRELESYVATQRRNFGGGAAPDDNLRSPSAWDVGILVVSIGASSSSCYA